MLDIRELFVSWLDKFGVRHKERLDCAITELFHRVEKLESWQLSGQVPPCYAGSAPLFYGKKFLEALGPAAAVSSTTIDGECEAVMVAVGKALRKRRNGKLANRQLLTRIEWLCYDQENKRHASLECPFCSWSSCGFEDSVYEGFGQHIHETHRKLTYEDPTRGSTAYKNRTASGSFTISSESESTKTYVVKAPVFGAVEYEMLTPEDASSRLYHQRDTILSLQKQIREAKEKLI